jgi:hypothetical protein
MGNDSTIINGESERCGSKRQKPFQGIIVTVLKGQRHLVKQSSSNQSDQRPHAYEAEGLTNTLLHLVE